jgi:ABC-type uncharacterized transport system ATPase subunit
MISLDAQATVQVEHLRKSFGAVHAVNDVSFQVYPGEVFGLLGPNGAGKTIDRFEIAEASLDDIFITVVQGQREEAADA